MKRYLVIDISPVCGRHVVGWTDNTGVKTEEVYRFAAAPLTADGHEFWDVEKLTEEVKAGIQAAMKRFGSIESLSICTSGYDYVLLKNGEAILPCYAYTDKRADRVKGLARELVPDAERLAVTGIGDPHISLFQLVSDQLNGRLEEADGRLMLSAYLLHRLGGSPAESCAAAGFTGLVNAKTREFDPELIRRFNLPEKLFPAFAAAGTVTGRYKGIKLVLGAGNRDASAVWGASDKGCYLVLNETGLMGVRTDNPMTDEARMAGGRNILLPEGFGFERPSMGLEVKKKLRRELCPSLSEEDIASAAEESEYNETADLANAVFRDPYSMKYAFDTLLSRRPVSAADYFRCACRSLASSIRKDLEEMTAADGENAGRVTLMGEGAEDALLLRFIRENSGTEIVTEAGDPVVLGEMKFQRALSRERAAKPERPQNQTAQIVQEKPEGSGTENEKNDPEAREQNARNPRNNHRKHRNRGQGQQPQGERPQQREERAETVSAENAPVSANAGEARQNRESRQHREPRRNYRPQQTPGEARTVQAQQAHGEGRNAQPHAPRAGRAVHAQAQAAEPRQNA